MSAAASGPLQYHRDEHRVHLIVYHRIWCPRRCKPVLVGPVAECCRALLVAQCAEQQWAALTLAMQPDHIHRFVRVWPADSAAEVVKAYMGVMSYALRRAFPGLRCLPSMWTRSYFSSTAGTVSQATIQRYIGAQKGR